MNKRKEEKKSYIAPFCELIGMNIEECLMVGSPTVGGNVSIEDPVEDDEDTEISGAKTFIGLDCWEDE